MGMMTEYYHFIFTTLVKYLAVHTPCTLTEGGWDVRVGWVSDPGLHCTGMGWETQGKGDLGPCQEERAGLDLAAGQGQTPVTWL